MRRLVTRLLPVALCLGLGLPLGIPTAAASDSTAADSGIAIDTSGDATYDVFTYRETEDGRGLVITSCDTIATQAEIPTEIDGVPVVEIGDAAFMSCNFLTSITVPEGIEVIGESAFGSCSILHTVSLPDSLREIGEGAFASCPYMLNVNIPDSITALPDALFYDCGILQDLTLPDGLTSIGNETFYSCVSLAQLALPDGLTSIGDYAFQNCQSLTTITIPAACTQIGDYAFDGCQALTEFQVAADNGAYCAAQGVLFDKDVTTLIRYPQAYAQTEYTVPDGCTRLEDWSFIGATTLESIDLNGVTEIGEDCFYYCTSLASITIPQGVTALPGATFAYCTALTEIALPSTLETLGDHCFYASTALQRIALPEGVTTIGDQCLYNCAALEEVSLPSTLTTIGDQAIGFYDSADTGETARMDQLVIQNNGSDAAADYIRHWRHYGSKLWIWLLVGGIVLVVAAGITALVLIRRSHNRIRPTSRKASATKRPPTSSAKKRR